MKVLIAAIISTVALVSTANADVIIANYDMADLAVVSGQNSSTSSVSAAVSGVTSSGFTENLTGGTRQDEFGRAGGTGTSLVPAGTNGFSARSLNSTPSNPWWEFTVTPVGSSLDFTTLVLDAGARDTIATNTNWDYDLSWSVDGNAALLGTFDGPTTTGALTVSLGQSVDLSSLASQTGAVTFRITPDRVSGTNGAISQRAGWIDNVVLRADVTPVSVPEPSSLAILAGIAGLAFTRRRR